MVAENAVILTRERKKNQIMMTFYGTSNVCPSLLSLIIIRGRERKQRWQESMQVPRAFLSPSSVANCDVINTSRVGFQVHIADVSNGDIWVNLNCFLVLCHFGNNKSGNVYDLVWETASFCATKLHVFALRHDTFWLTQNWNCTLRVQKCGLLPCCLGSQRLVPIQ